MNKNNNNVNIIKKKKISSNDLTCFGYLATKDPYSFAWDCIVGNLAMELALLSYPTNENLILNSIFDIEEPTRLPVSPKHWPKTVPTKN